MKNDKLKEVLYLERSGSRFEVLNSNGAIISNSLNRAGEIDAQNGGQVEAKTMNTRMGSSSGS